MFQGWPWKLAFAGALGIQLAWLITTIPQYIFAGSDFVQDFSAAKAIVQQRAIYGAELSEVARIIEPQGRYENFHPPFCSVFFLPFTLLSYPGAFFVWSLLTVCLYFLTIDRTLRYFGISAQKYYFFIPFFFLWYPFVATLCLGQVSVLLSFLVTVGWLSFRKKRFFSLGVVWALATSIKLFPGFLFLFLFLKREWRALFFAVIALFFFMLLTLLVVGSQDVFIYIQEIMPRNIENYGGYILNTSVTGYVFPLLQSNGYVRHFVDNPQLARFVASCWSLLIASITILSVCLRRDKGCDDFLFSLALATMLLISPISWQHSLVLMIFPFALLYTQARTLVGRIVFFGLLVLSMVPDVPIYRWLMASLSPGKIPGIGYLFGNLPFFCLFGLWNTFLYLIWRSPTLGDSSGR